MSYYYDDHDEDDLPEISIPTRQYTRDLSDDDDDDERENDQTKNSMEKWRGLYEASIHSLQSDDDDDDEPKATNEKPFYLERPPSERPQSPVYESNTTNKSKWEIRLPELLNATVGPDRQKREVIRRHTTNIVFQHAPEGEQNQSDETISNLPRTNPLVKQLKQKFDQMQVDNQTTKLLRIGSLNSRETTTKQPRPALPVRPTPEIIPRKPPTSLAKNHRDKSGPPVSYPKHFYPPPSTTSVVRQLIDSGATLVYDSKTPKATSVRIKPLIPNQRNIEETRDELISTNAPLTGRQMKPEQMKNKDNQRARKPTVVESDDEYHDAQTNHQYQARHRSSSVKN